MGNAHPSIAPYETLHCRDDVVAVACGNDGQFARLAAAVGLPDLAQDSRFATNSARVAHRRELVGILEAALAADDADAWVKVITDAGVPVGRVGDIGSALALADSLGLQPTLDLGPDHAPQVRHPITYSRSALRAPSPPPALGEHNHEVRARLAAPATRHTEGHRP
jgi:formyl-CoA transferase